MKNFVVVSAVALGFVFIGSNAGAYASNSYTLDECFSSALKRSETIGINTELVKQAEERYKQARAAVFPTINGVASYLIQESPSTGTTATSISPSEQTLVKLNATQGIFRGMREYAAISQQSLLVTAQLSARRLAAAQLYSDVATNFYNILMIEQQMRNFEAEVQIYRDRTGELGHRIQIGRSQRSEVLTVQSTLDTLLGTVERVRGQLLAEREVLHFLTGYPAQSKLEESPSTEPKPRALDTYLSRIEERPDVKSSRDQMDAAEKSVSIARAGHFPSVDVVANYYFKRPGISRDQNWDAQVIGTLPIFAGGAVNAQVREASALGRQAELTLARQRRLADQEIRTLFVQVQSDLAQSTQLNRSVQSAVESFRAETRDYKLGLVTNLDVLQSIATSQAVRRAYDDVRYQTRMDFVKLEIAAALRPLGDKDDFKYE